VDLIRGHKIFGAIQQHSEIDGLLQILRRDPPRYVCEIGTASGGTLFLLTQVCRPDALLLSVDLGLSVERCLVHRRFVSGKQRIVSIRGDSRTPETFARVRSLLRGHPLDLLFIDGDHSYEGVKADFVNFGPLVRPGGLIVLHDIVPDFGTRYGKPTGNYTGGVPVFWDEIKTKHKTTEFIEDPGQDGYGIGIIHN
jgi:predicted O-methyltransferase YrrM